MLNMLFYFDANKIQFSEKKLVREKSIVNLNSTENVFCKAYGLYKTNFLIYTLMFVVASRTQHNCKLQKWFRPNQVRKQSTLEI